MSTGTIIAIAIVVISLLILIIVAVVTRKKVAPTIQNINELNDVISQKSNYYTRESQHLNERVTTLTERVENIQTEVDVKMLHFKDFADEQGQFQSSIRFLKDHAADYGKGISSNVADEVKEDGPKIAEIFKRAFKKTAQKQKMRYQK